MDSPSLDIAQLNSNVLCNNSSPIQTIGQLEHALLGLFPAADALDWDKTGLIVGDPHAAFTGLAVALDATVDAVRISKELGASVLLTHHPVFLDGITHVHPQRFATIDSSAVVWEALNSGVALMNFHTALDVSVQASQVLPRMLGLELNGVLDAINETATKGFGQICSYPKGSSVQNLSQLAARCVSVFGRIPRVYGDPATPMNTIVTCTGSGSSLLQLCLDAQCDCLVCGEVRYHAALDALGAGLSIIELGHDVSELPLCAVLAQASGSVGVPEEAIRIIDQSYNWWTPEATRR